MARGPLAGTSGPGKFSKRTDMDLGSTAYGEGQETAMLNTAAPKSKTRGIADNVGGRPADPLAQMAPVTPLFAPSQKPTEPITSGIAMGEGSGPEALMMQSQFANRKLSDILVEMIPYDTTGEIQYLYQNALSRGQ
jgi:hypothetical protein